MVRGLDTFKTYFKGYEQYYVLIGGTACSVAMDEAGLPFRTTKDLDIVLCIEALDERFVEAFWGFIQKGHYQNEQQSTGKKLFYRFYEPIDRAYPFMIELFSRKPDALKYYGAGHLTPIPIDQEAVSLSAILLNNDYYDFVHSGKQIVDGLPVVIPDSLIPLKAKAYLDLKNRRDSGEKIDQKDINKHKNDVFRLYQLLSADASIQLPNSIKNDFSNFINQIETNDAVNLTDLGIRDISLAEILNILRSIYNCK